MHSRLNSTATQRYLSRHCETNLPQCPASDARWAQVVVVPAYRESEETLARLRSLSTDIGTALVILVLNRPDTDEDSTANQSLRQAVLALPSSVAADDKNLRALTENVDLYLFDLESAAGPLANSGGVGLARKYGCDLALQWITQGQIDSQWICTTDADATLPANYFEQLAALDSQFCAVHYPFWHHSSRDAIGRATALYELRLHHYVLGLRYAQSPYAHHTLGSCIAVKCEHYAQVHGFPARSGGEDFYFLNKLAKTGAIKSLTGPCIRLEARQSTRVPFGTGPAVAQLLESGAMNDAALFYHPACFEALRSVITAAKELAESRSDEPEPTTARTLPKQLVKTFFDRNAVSRLPKPLYKAATKVLSELGLESCLAHCQRQSRTPAQFEKQFHQWFDGFRTLKFIHGLRARGWENCSLMQLHALEPAIWPETARDTGDVEAIRRALALHWGWELPAPVTN